MKIIALDIGDQWIGTALSDALGISAKPYKTVAASELISFIKEITEKERIKSVVIGYPITLRGKKSEQTEKIIEQKELLEKQFTNISFILWDERLSSQYASKLKKAKTKDEKQHSHSIAAAFILKSYLDHIAQQKKDI